MSKQTAVDWLVDQMFKQGYFDGNKPLSITNLDHLQYEAKAMEREQIIDAHKQGEEFALVMNMPDSKEYYDMTYKGGEQ